MKLLFTQNICVIKNASTDKCTQTQTQTQTDTQTHRHTLYSRSGGQKKLKKDSFGTVLVITRDWPFPACIYKHDSNSLSTEQILRLMTHHTCTCIL